MEHIPVYKIQQYLQKNISEREGLEIKIHLEFCSKCRKMLEFEENFDQVLKSITLNETSADFIKDVMIDVGLQEYKKIDYSTGKKRIILTIIFLFLLIFPIVIINSGQLYSESVNRFSDLLAYYIDVVSMHINQVKILILQTISHIIEFINPINFIAFPAIYIIFILLDRFFEKKYINGYKHVK